MEQQSKLLELADNMAAAASMFNAHGYSMFIQAREELIEALEKIFKDSIPANKYQ